MLGVKRRHIAKISQICGGHLIILVAGFSHAQTFRGATNGNVVDPSGAVVSEAEVRVINNGTRVTLTTASTSEGQSAFQDLPLGSYKVTVNAPGFQAVNVDNVLVTAGWVYTLPVKLTMGRQTTAIEVSAPAVTVDTATATQNMTIPSTVVQNVPPNGWDFTQFIAAAPGYGGYAVGGYGSLNGTRPNQMNWQIDGVDNNDLWHDIFEVTTLSPFACFAFPQTEQIESRLTSPVLVTNW
jgi:hypothetical protein